MTKLFSASLRRVGSLSVWCVQSVIELSICSLPINIVINLYDILATKFFASQLQVAKPATTASAVNPRLLPPTHTSLAWPLGQEIAIHVYLSTSPTGDVFSPKLTSGWRQDQDGGLPNFVWENVTFGDYNEARVVEYDVRFPDVSPLFMLVFGD